MADRIQLELVFEEDIAVLPPMMLHEKLLEESIFFSQLEKIAAALPGSDRLVAC